MADVIRDLPAAVAALGARVTVFTPSYGTLHRLPGARALEVVATVFRGRRHRAHVYDVPVAPEGVRCLVVDHRLVVPTEPGIVYHGDESTRPYATDATKFAFFCTVVAGWLAARPQFPAALHLHDWHCGVLAVLRRYDGRYGRLRRIPTVFTIHNLAYQGQRPLRGDPSSLHAWFPGLDYELAGLSDPAYAEVFNPMAAAIRLCDRVSTVSPTYAREICQPSQPATGFIGGEGLEHDLRQRADEDALAGILNGCAYPDRRVGPLPWSGLSELLEATVSGWLARSADAPTRRVHATALRRIRALQPTRPRHVLTSVGRIVDQKMRLMFTNARPRKSALAAVLEDLGDDGVVILLGSGDPHYEATLARLAGRYPNLIFLRGYSEAAGDALYSTGDLFLMPSSFEPCGISQMLAMRAGQPCVVHGVGGLRDTVRHRETGFVFDGSTPAEQASAFVRCVAEALELRERDPARFAQIREAAEAERFRWSDAAREYWQRLYDLE